jgi:hypothetical protein
MSTMQHPHDSEIIIEYRTHGRSVKVTAIDPITHEEVSIIGDARHSQDFLARQAAKKLRVMQEKR